MHRSRKRNRAGWYDYSYAGWYFVTMCTQFHTEWFGVVRDGVVDRNEYGDIVQRQWEWLAEQYPYVELDEFVVMPNHVHGIVVIRNNLTSCRDRSPCRRDNPRIVPTVDDSISQNKQFVKNRRHNRLSKTMSAFKTTSSKYIHQSGLSEFVWQRSFHDRIIRSEKQLHAIQMYIRTNPCNWEEDVYNS